MKKFQLNGVAKACALAAVAYISPALSAEPAKTEKPNIIVIMADDLGQWANGFRNPGMIETPNLEYLAENGVRFENAMTPAPVSSAARASFHTGKMPSQHGVYDFLSDNKKTNVNWLEGEKLLSERMQELGYRTALLGKWHATLDTKKPVRGFDHWVSHYPQKKIGWKNQYAHSGTVRFSDDGESIKYTGIQAHYLTDETIKFIDEQSNKPFFVSLNFVEPHFPFEGLPERLVDKYRAIAHKIVAFGGNSALDRMSKYSSNPADHEEKLAQYLAAVTLLDDQLGRLMDSLEGRKLLDNTVVTFVSDHGLLMGQYGLYGKVNASFPYNYYEETIRVPFVISGPKEIVRPKQVRGEFVDILDLHATILELANAGNTYDSSYGPGKSLLPMLKGERVRAWREYQFSERGNSRMVTNGHWKLVRYYDKNKNPIDNWYDLSHPLGEKYISVPPREEQRTTMITAMDDFFAKYSNEAHSGLNSWEIDYPNYTTEKILQNELWN